MTKREAIISFRKMVQERTADSTYTDKDLYTFLNNTAKWLIKREISSGRIYRNTSFFQTLGCQEVEEVSTIDKCCPIKVKCKIYRTKEILPDMYTDNSGPVIKSVTSVDGSTSFTMISPTIWQNKRNDPYQKFSSEKYFFPHEGRLWFPEHNPHFVNVDGFYTDDVERFKGCDETKKCVRFLDTKLMVPDWVQDEMFMKALNSIIPSKNMPEDMQIDKNTNRKN